MNEETTTNFSNQLNILYELVEDYQYTDIKLSMKLDKVTDNLNILRNSLDFIINGLKEKNKELKLKNKKLVKVNRLKEKIISEQTDLIQTIEGSLEVE